MYYVAWYLWIGFFMAIWIGGSLYNDYVAGYPLAVRAVEEGREAFGKRLFWLAFVGMISLTYPYFMGLVVFENVMAFLKRRKIKKGDYNEAKFKENYGIGEEGD